MNWQWKIVLLINQTIFAFVEGFHLPDGQVSWRENKIIHYKVPFKVYRNSNFCFLVNFIFVLSTFKRSYDGSNLGKGCSRFFNLVATIPNSERRTKLTLFFSEKNINSTQLNNKTYSNNLDIRTLIFGKILWHKCVQRARG